jgi:hypothetical protein
MNMANQQIAPENEAFYKRLAPCDRFDVVGDLRAFAPLPDDWHIVIGDIRDSTPAITAGRYKDVNMVGAACIVAALNAVPAVDLPYVFGGDGATLAVPDSALDRVADALLRLRALAARSFDLDLRIGRLQVGELRARGADVLVARLRVGTGNHLALFAGDGVELADRLIKADDDGAAGFAMHADTNPDPDLEGLSCRWEPLRSQRGRMVNLLIRTRTGDAASAAARYHEVLDDLEAILRDDPLSGHPVRAGNMRFRWPPRGLGVEAELTKGRGTFWRRYLKIWRESVVQFWLERFDMSAGGYDAPAYREELRNNTDFRRFDGTLRLVVDCRPDELARIRAMLAERRARGELDYGLHTADSALMTCLVFDLAESRHLHFIDGSDGGFAVAARGLKAQLARADRALASGAGAA